MSARPGDLGRNASHAIYSHLTVNAIDGSIVQRQRGMSADKRRAAAQKAAVLLLCCGQSCRMSGKLPFRKCRYSGWSPAAAYSARM
ncbi:MAG: hypothetical protein IJI82_01995, partial [Clostridia bacterium]|nr:hypothetical protein [Clostridia bacterium]